MSMSESVAQNLTETRQSNKLGRSIDMFLFLIAGVGIFAFAALIHEHYPLTADILAIFVTICVPIYLTAATILKVKELIDSFRRG